MRGSNDIWHRPYVPIGCIERYGIPHICRIAPNKNSFEFEWISHCDGSHTLYYGVRGKEEKTAQIINTRLVKVDDLTEDTDYEFFIRDEDGNSSLLRYVRTGAVIDGMSVINYLHPDDTYYDFSGRYICTPSIVKIKGRLIASIDVYGPKTPQNLMLLFKSDDDGKTWEYLCDLFPFYWATLFEHKGILYVLGASTEYGNIQISCSNDRGETWSPVTVIFYGSVPQCKYGGNHRAPMHLTSYNGRLYTSVEFGGYKQNLPMVMSIDENDDLMVASNWVRSAPIPFDGRWKEDCNGQEGDCIEGNLTIGSDGNLYNIVRWKIGEWVKFKVNTKDLDAPLEYVSIDKAPVTTSMFRLVPYKKGHLLITNRKTESTKYIHHSYRNVLSLYYTEDLKNFTFINDIVNLEDIDPERVGYQYPAPLLEGDEMKLLIRSAFNNPSSFHNSNYLIYCKIDVTTGEIKKD